MVRCSARSGNEAHGDTGLRHNLHGVCRIVAQVYQGTGTPEHYVASRITLLTFDSCFLTDCGVSVVALGPASAWSFILHA